MLALGCACNPWTEKVDPCRPDPCHGHGTCLEGNCGCDPGFAGAFCDACAAGYFGYPDCRPAIAFAATFGASGQEWAANAPATGNNYLLAGFSSSFGGGSWDLWLHGLDENGDPAGCANADLGRSASVGSAAARAAAKNTSGASSSTAATSADLSVQEHAAHSEAVFQCGGG